MLETVGTQIIPTEAMKTRVQKQDQVQKISERLRKAKAVVFADFKGMTMKQLSGLRDTLRDQDAEFLVTKNTLLHHSLPTNYQLPTTVFEGPTATLFAYDDEVSPIKTLVAALKNNGIGKVKAGFLGADTLDETKVQQLATLPTKDELRAKTVGVLAAPLQGIVGVLQGNLRNLVYALDQIKLSKGGV